MKWSCLRMEQQIESFDVEVPLAGSAGSKQRASFRLALLMLVMFGVACRSQVEKTNNQTAIAAGEPQRYTATVVRSVEEQDRREIEVTRVMRSGSMIREEWSEEGETRALISRPDLGRAFLLSLDRKVYIELDLSAPGENRSRSTVAADNGGRRARSSEVAAGELGIARIEPEQIERQFGYTMPPSTVELLSLPDQRTDEHPCRVEEKRAVYDDGRTEVTRVFRATDLSGLVVRIESETRTTNGLLRLITERRDVRLDVTEDQFDIPPGFKRVTSL